MMLISLSFALGAILLSSGNALSQSNNIDQTSDDGEDQANNGGDDDNSV